MSGILLDQSMTISQSLGLCALICIAIREQTTIKYQWEELNFSDIPQDIIHQIDDSSDMESQIALVNYISRTLLEDEGLFMLNLLS